MLKSFFQKHPNHEWRWLKLLLIGTLVISLSGILFERLFALSGLPIPYEVFALTAKSYSYGFIWQFLTYPLMQPAFSGLTLGYLLSLGFHCYLLWMVGSAICKSRSEKSFIYLYVFSTLFTALSLIGIHFWLNIPLAYAGGKALTYTLLLSWAALNPDSRLLLFFLAPVRATTIILVGLGFNLFLDLTNLAFHEIAAYMTATLYTYFHILFVWKTKGPFPFLYNFEERLKKLTSSFSWKKKSMISDSKIFDIKTGRAISNDKAFFHAAMAKITLKGKKSLTWRENGDFTE